MRDALAHGKHHLLHIQGPLEHHRQHIMGIMRLLTAGSMHLIQLLGMVIRQRIDPRMQPPERQTVGRQHQRVFRQCIADYCQAIHKSGYRIGVRLRGAHHQITGNGRQHLIPTEQYPVTAAIQTQMLRCMAAADIHLPTLPIDGQRVTLGHQLGALRQGHHHPAKTVPLARHLGQVFTLQPMAAQKALEALNGLGIGGITNTGGQLPLAAAHDHRRLALLLQPARHTQMIRVIVGNDHPGDRFSVELLCQQLLPDFPAAPNTKAGIHNHPTLVIFQQPEVDMVERKRQRETQPENAFGHLETLTCRWQISKRVD